MSAIPSTIVNQATLVYGRQVFVPAPGSLPYWKNCVHESKWQLSPANLRIAATTPLFEGLFERPPPVPYCSEITKVVAIWSRHTSRPSMNLQEELSANERRHVSWQPRTEMFATAMGTGESFNGILAISVEPTDSSVEQLLYYGHSYVNDSRAATHALSEVTEDYSREQVGPRISEGPTLRGFFRPFNHFSSRMFSPEYSKYAPDSLSGPRLKPAITRHITKETGLEPYIRDIEPADLRDRVKSLATAFLADAHSQTILITTVQPTYTPQSPFKENCFTKW